MPNAERKTPTIPETLNFYNHTMPAVLLSPHGEYILTCSETLATANVARITLTLNEVFNVCTSTSTVGRFTTVDAPASSGTYQVHRDITFQSHVFGLGDGLGYVVLGPFTKVKSNIANQAKLDRMRHWKSLYVFFEDTSGKESLEPFSTCVFPVSDNFTFDNFSFVASDSVTQAGVPFRDMSLSLQCHGFIFEYSQALVALLTGTPTLTMTVGTASVLPDSGTLSGYVVTPADSVNRVKVLLKSPIKLVTEVEGVQITFKRAGTATTVSTDCKYVINTAAPLLPKSVTTQSRVLAKTSFFMYAPTLTESFAVPLPWSALYTMLDALRYGDLNIVTVKPAILDTHPVWRVTIRNWSVGPATPSLENVFTSDAGSPPTWTSTKSAPRETDVALKLIGNEWQISTQSQSCVLAKTTQSSTTDNEPPRDADWTVLRETNDKTVWILFSNMSSLTDAVQTLLSPYTGGYMATAETHESKLVYRTRSGTATKYLYWDKTAWTISAAVGAPSGAEKVVVDAAVTSFTDSVHDYASRNGKFHEAKAATDSVAAEHVVQIAVCTYVDAVRIDADDAAYTGYYVLTAITSASLKNNRPVWKNNETNYKLFYDSSASTPSWTLSKDDESFKKQIVGAVADWAWNATLRVTCLNYSKTLVYVCAVRRPRRHPAVATQNFFFDLCGMKQTVELIDGVETAGTYKPQYNTTSRPVSLATEFFSGLSVLKSNYSSYWMGAWDTLMSNVPFFNRQFGSNNAFSERGTVANGNYAAQVTVFHYKQKETVSDVSLESNANVSELFKAAYLDAPTKDTTNTRLTVKILIYQAEQTAANTHNLQLSMRFSVLMDSNQLNPRLLSLPATALEDVTVHRQSSTPSFRPSAALFTPSDADYLAALKRYLAGKGGVHLELDSLKESTGRIRFANPRRDAGAVALPGAKGGENSSREQVQLGVRLLRRR